MGAVLDPHRGKHENASRTVVLAEGLGGIRSDRHQVPLPVPNVVIDKRVIVASASRPAQASVGASGGHRRGFSLPSYCSCQSGERLNKHGVIDARGGLPAAVIDDTRVTSNSLRLQRRDTSHAKEQHR